MVDAVQVAVRVRPLNVKEQSEGKGKTIVKVERNSISLTNPKFLHDPAYASDRRVFHFDKCFAFEGKDYATQEAIFQNIGSNVVENAFNGFNCCIFAYGQVRGELEIHRRI